MAEDELTIVNVSGKKAVVRTKLVSAFFEQDFPKTLRPPEYALSSSSTTTARFVDLTPCEYWPHSQQASEDQPEEVGFAVELFLEAGAESSGADTIATTVSFMMAAMVYGAAMLM
jgi:hypothetical protein